MLEVPIIGIDIAKRVFHLHGAQADGSTAFRKKLSRAQFLPFLAKESSCVVAMEACATAHGLGREIAALGHTVRLIPPAYVKPYVKRQKNDAADAEAIAEAASRPTMRFVSLKTEEQQARAMVFRTRQMFVRQRTQTINALRGHLAEYGVVAPKGPANITKLLHAIEDKSGCLPETVRELARTYIDQIEMIGDRIADLNRKMSAMASDSEVIRRLQSMPGVGPVTAVARETFAPPMQSFRRGRDFAAWLGLVPRQHSTGGKPRLGTTSKMGQRDIRRLLITGAMAMIRAVSRRAEQDGSWLTHMLARKPRMLVAIALANKMARGLWAMVMKGEDYRDPAAAA